MPVLRYRRIEDMPDAGWLPAGSPELWRAIRRTWALARSMAPWRPTPGLHRFRTMAEANAQRREWDRATLPVGLAPDGRPES